MLFIGRYVAAKAVDYMRGPPCYGRRGLPKNSPCHGHFQPGTFLHTQGVTLPTSHTACSAALFPWARCRRGLHNTLVDKTI